MKGRKVVKTEPDSSKPTGRRAQGFCSLCGAKVPRFGRVCPKCGADLECGIFDELAERVFDDGA